MLQFATTGIAEAEKLKERLASLDRLGMLAPDGSIVDAKGLPQKPVSKDRKPIHISLTLALQESYCLTNIDREGAIRPTSLQFLAFTN